MTAIPDALLKRQLEKLIKEHKEGAQRHTKQTVTRTDVLLATFEYLIQNVRETPVDRLIASFADARAE